MASKWSSGTRYGHWWWGGLWWFGKRDMCGCHNHGNKDKCGSSPTMTSHKPLVMHNSSHSSMHTTTCTPTWLHGGWETQWPHRVWLHSVLSLQAETSGTTMCWSTAWLMPTLMVSSWHFTNKLYRLLPGTCRQRPIHTVSEKRCENYCAIARSHSLMSW